MVYTGISFSSYEELELSWSEGCDDASYCFCDEGGPMIECSTKKHCSNSQWFHLSWVDMTIDEMIRLRDEEEDWWCYCKKSKTDARMIGCEGPNCKVKWFHCDCKNVLQVS